MRAVQKGLAMGTNMMDYWGWGPMWYSWLFPVVVLVLVAWLIIRITNHYRSRQG